MTLWACASCGSTAMCEHRELELVAWVLAVSAGAVEFADPLPPRTPPAREIANSSATLRKAASQ